MIKHKLKAFALSVMMAGLSLHVLADEASLKKAFEATYPRIKISSVSKTPYGGLYEVFAEGQIFYTDEKFSFLIAEGHLVDTKTKKDITDERMDDLTKIDFNSLPFNQAIKVVKGDGSRKMAVFADADCPFCKRLEQRELSQINNVTVYTFLYPLEQLHPDAANKSRAIWCAPDRAKAWMDWAMTGALPSAKSCDNPLEKNAQLGRKLGVNSTPIIFFADGKRINGAYPAQEIEKALTAASKK